MAAEEGKGDGASNRFDGGNGGGGMMAMLMRLFRRVWIYWPGVPGMVLLLGMWWDSGGYHSLVDVGRGGMNYKLQLELGSIWWQQTTEWRKEGVAKDHFDTGRTALQSVGVAGPRGRQFDLPPALSRYATSFGGQQFKRDIVIVQLGLWAIVAGYVALWAVLVFAWHARKRRMKANVERGALNRNAVAGDQSSLIRGVAAGWWRF
ncbi:hypothetical protein [Luteolibacter soli]|uniref:Uncharacterized protein n=1 Tax=Luteolibacter soli TaxID=3135280 RepID=A0ABU9AX09_9BACT